MFVSLTLLKSLEENAQKGGVAERDSQKRGEAVSEITTTEGAVGFLRNDEPLGFPKKINRGTRGERTIVTSRLKAKARDESRGTESQADTKTLLLKGDVKVSGSQQPFNTPSPTVV